jgi:hypothetical protein
MKGACQGKTSPLLAIKSYFFDRQPSTYPSAMQRGSVVDLLADAWMDRRPRLFLFKHDGHSVKS